jgi:hypothetical protein
VRARFQEYVARFVRVAARYEEEVRGSTTIGFPSQTYSVERGLGSGIMFTDDGAGQRELLANASRIEGWQKTNAYRYFEIVSACFANFQYVSEIYVVQGL